MEPNISYFIINIIIFLYLSFSTYTDIKTNMISIKVSSFSLVAILLSLLLCNRLQLLDILYSIIPCLIIFALSYLTRESIGYGDALLIGVIGIGLGFNKILLICTLAFILSAISAVFLIIKKKSGKATLPFVPFIFLSYIFCTLTF